jgi:4-amino-4-deoxy-L-arabinose transferase-like glycosyltransferase
VVKRKRSSKLEVRGSNQRPLEPRTSDFELGLILLVAAILRLWRLSDVPPGLNVDEAANGWNAFTLARTLHDQHGVLLPILDSAGYGQGLSTLLLYVMAPFVGIFGPTSFAIRLPGVIAGVATVALVYCIGRRLFDRRVGLIAAALLAVLPWHLQLSRWGHMATLFPLAVAAVVLLMLRADNWKRALVAGAVVGLSLYGYYAIRLWMPLFLIATAFVWWRRWRELAAFLAGMIAVAAPLIYGTLFNPLLQKRAQLTWVWDAGDSLGTKIAKVAARYPPHFGLDFLFRRGDLDPTDSPPTGHGYLFWVMLPLLIAGAAFLIAKLRMSPSARFMTALVVLYPAADLLNRHPSAHSLRGAPGVVALTLLAAIGAVALFDIAGSFRVPIAIALALWAGIETVRFIPHYFSEFKTNARKYDAYTADLHESLRWLAPRFGAYDAVLITGSATSHPYIRTLLELHYPPKQWLADQKEFRDGPLPDGAYRDEQYCVSFGKVHFLFGGDTLNVIGTLQGNGKTDRVAMILRPGELSALAGTPVLRIYNPNGDEVLWVCEGTL